MSSSPPPHPVIVRGREALGRGDLPGAEDAAAERLKSAAGDIDALELRYLVQKQRGQALEAVKTLDAVIGTDPRTEWAYNELVQIFMTHGRLADAAEVARTALRVNPGSAHGHNLFGLVLSEMNDLPPGVNGISGARWSFPARMQRISPTWRSICSSRAARTRRMAISPRPMSWRRRKLRRSPIGPLSTKGAAISSAHRSCWNAPPPSPRPSR